jgi:FSR family fosmidomycin resistance protein-like MFS transporter
MDENRGVVKQNLKMTNPDRKDKVAILSLSVGHFINDAYSNFLGPLLPFLVGRLKLSIAEAGGLAAILVISSSFAQPLYGYISDRYLKRVFVVFSPLVTALFMSCLGLANSYAMLALLLVCGGVGIASFHPQGAAMTALASRDRKGLGMSIFVTSGTIGYSLGPLLITYTVQWFGLEHSYFVMIPGLVVFAMLFFLVPATDHSSKVAIQQDLRQSLGAVWQPLSQLYILVVIRSAVQMCFVNFLPLYFSQKGLPPLMAGKATTLFLFFGALGGFSGGTLADRFGGKNVISFSMLFSAPLIMGFLLTNGISSYFLLAFGGVALLSTVPVNVVMAQNLMPHNASVVSALMMGLAWGVGGMFVPLIGRIADIAGLGRALMVVALLPLIGFAVAVFLPPERTAEPVAAQSPI